MKIKGSEIQVGDTFKYGSRTAVAQELGKVFKTTRHVTVRLQDGATEGITVRHTCTMDVQR